MISGGFIRRNLKGIHFTRGSRSFEKGCEKPNLNVCRTVLVRYANAIPIKSYEKIHHPCASSFSG